MAEPLKHQFGTDVAEQVGDALALAAAGRGAPFDREAFVADAVAGFGDLELGARAQQVADAMATHLPDDRTEAIAIVASSLGPELDGSDEFGMATFFYWPHVKFVADHGQDDLEPALALQYELTKRFTAEFSIRAYLAGPIATRRSTGSRPGPRIRTSTSGGWSRRGAAHGCRGRPGCTSSSPTPRRSCRCWNDSGTTRPSTCGGPSPTTSTTSRRTTPTWSSTCAADGGPTPTPTAAA